VITVLIVDDQPLQRLGFRMLLDSHPDTTVVGESANGPRPCAPRWSCAPTSSSWTCGCPAWTASRPTRRIVAAGGRSRILVLTTFDIDQYAHAALRAGASGFLLKDARPEELAGRYPRRRRRRRGHRPGTDPAPARRLRPAPGPGGRPPTPPTPGWRPSPNASTRSSWRSATAGPTARSPSAWCCPSPRSRPTSAGAGEGRRARPHPGRDPRLRPRAHPPEYPRLTPTTLVGVVCTVGVGRSPR